MTIRRGYIDVDSGQLHYRYAGDDRQAAVLLLHQSPSSSVMFESMMAVLAADYFVLAPDLPGFGASDPLPGSVSVGAWTVAVEQFLKALDVRDIHIFGHHTGAAVAAQLAVNAGVRCPALALSGPTLLTDAQKAALPAQASAFPLQQDGSHLLGMWERIGKKEPAAELSLRLRETLLGLALGDSYPEAYAAVIEHDFASLLPDLTMPVLLMAGSRDPLQSCVAPTLALLADGHTLDLGDTGSWCCDLAATTIANALREFFCKGADRVAVAQ